MPTPTAVLHLHPSPPFRAHHHANAHRCAPSAPARPQVPALLAEKLAQGKISREEHDAILQAHALSTRPTVPGVAEASAGQAVPAAAMAPLEVLCTTFNMGNCPLDAATRTYPFPGILYSPRFRK